MPRRAPGEGSVRQLPSGRWSVQVSVPDAGRRRRISRTAPTRREAERIRRRLLDEIAGGGHAAPRQRLGAYLADYLETTVRPLESRSTYAIYRWALERHIGPALGHAYLDALTPTAIQTFQADKLKRYAPATVRAMLAFLGVALAQAESFGLLARNPVPRVRKPSIKRKEPPAVTAAEGRAILAAFQDTRLGPMVTCGLLMGLRIGELLGLRWEDIDFAAGTMRVERQWGDVRGRAPGEPSQAYRALKRRREHAVLPLPGQVVTALRHQRARVRRLRLMAGERWHDQDAVFPSQYGRPMDSGQVNLEFRRGLVAAGLRSRSFHQLRHGTATLLASLGVPVNVTGAVLGHMRGSAVTLSTYVHTDQSQIKEAMERLSAALEG